MGRQKPHISPQWHLLLRPGVGAQSGQGSSPEDAPGQPCPEPLGGSARPPSKCSQPASLLFGKHTGCPFRGPLGGMENRPPGDQFPQPALPGSPMTAPPSPSSPRLVPTWCHPRLPVLVRTCYPGQPPSTPPPSPFPYRNLPSASWAHPGHPYTAAQTLSSSLIRSQHQSHTTHRHLVLFLDSPFFYLPLVFLSLLSFSLSSFPSQVCGIPAGGSAEPTFPESIVCSLCSEPPSGALEFFPRACLQDHLGPTLHWSSRCDTVWVGVRTGFHPLLWPSSCCSPPQRARSPWSQGDVPIWSPCPSLTLRAVLSNRNASNGYLQFF